MKKLLILCSFLLCACVSSDKKITENEACCEIEDAQMGFAKFANNQEFIDKHEDPLALNYISENGEKITFKTPDGKEGYGFEIKAKKKSKKYLFVFHEWWGLNDYIMRESEHFANDLEDVNVIAIDLYDGQVAAKREDASKIMQSIDKERAANIVRGALEYAGKKAKIATVGWCFGGGWSLQASLLLEKQAIACVIYYGMPEKDKEKLKNLNAEVLGIFAGKEQFISPAIVSEFEANMKALNKTITVKSFDADHGFANPSNPKYNKEFGDQAYQMSLDFLKKKF